MQLQSIRIKNFKGITDTSIHFKEGFNLLIGDNGVGKTSILEAISVGLGGFLVGIDGIATKHIVNDEVRVQSEIIGDGSYDLRANYPVSIECEAEIADENYIWTRQKKSTSGRTTVEPRDICKVAKILREDKMKVLPLISYQSTARMWAQKRKKVVNMFTSKNYSRSIGYTDCLVDESNGKMILNWCAKMDMIGWQQEKKISEYEAVKKAVVTFMGIVCDDTITGVRFDKQRETLVLMMNEEIFPIYLLSSGYQSLLWMVFDIAYRMAILNPDLRSEAVERTNGIVLIDELDLHLHPKWQWNIIEALKTTFPLVQFIVATHSPVLISSCKGENLIRVHKNLKVEYHDSAYGQQVNSILKYYQDSDERVQKVKRMFAAFDQAVDAEKYEEAQKIYENLEKEIGENDPDMVSARITLDLEISDNFSVKD